MTLMFIDATRIPPRITFFSISKRQLGCLLQIPFATSRRAAGITRNRLELRPGLEPSARVETHRIGDGDCDREGLALDKVPVI